MSSSTPTPSPEPDRPFGLGKQILVSCLWLAYNIQWGALLAVVLPAQIEQLVGPDRKEFYNGLIGPIGGFVALVVAPLAGALSDRCRHPWGRRRPYLLWGGLINLVFLMLLPLFGKNASFGGFVVCYLGLQLGCNIWGGPYAGLIPDVVPRANRGSASGWMAVMTALGTIIGALSAGQLMKISLFAVYILIAVSQTVLMAVTLLGVRETPRTAENAPFKLGSFLRSFLLDPREYRDFYWVLATRAMVTMGIYSIFTFFQFFLKDVVRVDNPVERSSFLIGIITVTGILPAVLAGPVSDRVGRKPLVYLSGGVMALVAFGYCFVARSPSWELTAAMGALFGIGYGAYQAVDWALAIDVLPGGEDAAKDMGIWHVAIVLPQILAPFITGSTLSLLKGQSITTAYSYVFIMTAIWFVLGTVFVRAIRGVR